MLGRSLVDTIIPPRHRDGHRSGLARFLATGESHILDPRIDITASDRHGREFPVEVTVWAVDDGTDTVSFHAFVHDISERQAYQDALLASEARHRHLADQLAAAQQIAGIGIWEWDIGADTLAWSDELCRIFGVEQGSHPATYAEYLTRVDPDDRTGVDAAIQHAFTTGRPFVFDHRVVLADHGLRIVHCLGDVALDEAGTAVRMTGTAQDVTEREMAAEALRRSESRLAEAQATARLGSWEWDIVSGDDDRPPDVEAPDNDRFDRRSAPCAGDPRRRPGAGDRRQPGARHQRGRMTVTPSSAGWPGRPALPSSDGWRPTPSPSTG